MRGGAQVVLVFVMCAAIGAFGERFLTRKQWLALYFAGAIAGHAIGEVFQPLEGGTSVVFVGILGGLAATRWSAASPGWPTSGFRPPW